MKSMTGYGRCEIDRDDRKVSVEIKSENHRYLELGVKIPRKLNYLDNDIRNLAKEYASRGKVDIFVSGVSALKLGKVNFEIFVET